VFGRIPSLQPRSAIRSRSEVRRTPIPPFHCLRCRIIRPWSPASQCEASPRGLILQVLGHDASCFFGGGAVGLGILALEISIVGETGFVVGVYRAVVGMCDCQVVLSGLRLSIFAVVRKRNAPVAK
jgi:hypothetical protein